MTSSPVIGSPCIGGPVSGGPVFGESVSAPAYTVELIYDEQFTVDRAAVITNNVPFAASHVGNTKLWSAQNSYISGGQFNFTDARSAYIIDATAHPGRTRLAGRIHYCAHTQPVTTNFQSFIPLGIVGESPASNWWAGTEGFPAIKVKNTGSPGAIRMKGPTGTDGVFLWKAQVVGSTKYEWAIIERSVGCFFLVRIADGDWRLLNWEKDSSQSGKIHHRNIGAGYTTLDRLCTANTSFVPVPLVQHSFASALTPSDGTGQPDAGGNGVTGTTSGDVTIAGSALQMNSDGEGFVYFETGETEVGMSADVTVYDGSRAGFVLRVVDASNYIAVVANSTANTLSIIEVIAGSPTTLASIDTNTAPDNYDLPNATDLQFRAHIDGNTIRAAFGPDPLHNGYIETTTTRFASATKAGVLVSKGAAVNSSKASNFVAFAQVQNGLPAMVNTG